MASLRVSEIVGPLGALMKGQAGMRVLVTGATGNIGRRVVDHLLGHDVDIRALTTNPASAQLPAEVEVFTGYIGRPETVEPALQGVDRVYLAPMPETTAEVCRLAREAGVHHIVDLSGEKDSHWGDVARAVEESGVTWTHLSPGEFMENTLIWSDQIKQGDTVRDSYADAANALISMDDIARVAATALLEGGHEGRQYELTGPETLTRKEQVHQIGIGLGRDLQFVEVAHEEAVRILEPLMGEAADWYLSLKAELLSDPHYAVYVHHDGREMDIVEYLTGVPATSLSVWAQRNVELFGH